jgi:dTDP-4-dehydrorhamnose reductase
VNCAAATDVDRCEREPEWAYCINAQGARNVAEACGAVGARLIHISTDFVFSGDLGRPYDETDAVDPVNVYGQSKLAGEREVFQACASSTVVRTQWLYGRPGRSFPRAILNLAKTRTEAGLRIVDDQIGAPTWTVHLAQKLAWLVEQRNSLPGVVHINNAGECSRYEWVVELLRAAGLDDVPVTPCKSSEFKTDARRPAHSTLRRLALEYAGADDLPDWREGVAGFVAELRAAGEL